MRSRQEEASFAESKISKSDSVLGLGEEQKALVVLRLPSVGIPNSNNST